MFKKSLLALALVGASLSANAAVSVTTNATKDAAFPISKQGLPATGVYTLATAAENIEIDFVASDISAMTNTNFLVVEISGGFFQDATVAEVTDTNNRFAVNAGKSTSTKLYFGMTGVIASDIHATNPEFAIQGLKTLVTAGSTAVQLKAYIETPSGLTVANTDSAFKTVASIANQWSTKVTALNAKIDVSKENKSFTLDLADSATTDTATFTYKTVGTGATPSGVNVTIDGDFTGIASVTGMTINTAKTQATKVITSSVPAFLAAADAIVFTLESGTKAVAQAEREFKATVNVTYTDSEAQAGSLLLADSASIGKWELNSSSMTMNYVPMGPNTQLIVNATSKFSEAASVDVSYLAATGKMVPLADVASVAPGVVTKLGDAISAAILADMGTTSGKTLVKVSVNAPEGNVSFFTGFTNKSDGSRMALEQVNTDAATAATQATTAATQSTASNTILDTLTATVTDLASVTQTVAEDAKILASARAAVAASTTVTTLSASEKAMVDAVCNAGSTSGGFSTATIASGPTGTCL